MKKQYFAFFIFFIGFNIFGIRPLSISAQNELPAGLDCAGVRVWLKQNFYDGKFRNLGYTPARQKMYAYIDNYNDSLTCVYGGYKQYHKRGNETSSILPINAEHTIPQSFFGEQEPMRADIHHLFPTYDTWNAVRANYPFTDIPDVSTTKWMVNRTEQATIPAVNIDVWAEFNVRSSQFEPREVQKGNTARAILYFYTVYPTQAGSITSTANLQTLKQWHEQDPPDSTERERNNRVEVYQGNRNPFIDYPEWANRAWFCGLTSPTAELAIIDEVKISPNPVGEELTIDFNVKTATACNMLIINSLGQIVKSYFKDNVVEGNNKMTIPTGDLVQGVYIIRLQTKTLDGVGVSKILIKY